MNLEKIKCFRIDEETEKRLEKLAMETDKSLSDIIRELLESKMKDKSNRSQAEKAIFFG